MDQNLIEFIERVHGPMVWGTDDCCTFVADWLKIQTGQDLMCDWRRLYCDQESAEQALRDNGTGGLIRAIIEAARDRGWERVSTDQVFDRPAVAIAHMWGIGYCACANYGSGWFIGRGTTGVVLFPGWAARRAWACPQ